MHRLQCLLCPILNWHVRVKNSALPSSLSLVNVENTCQDLKYNPQPKCCGTGLDIFFLVALTRKPQHSFTLALAATSELAFSLGPAMLPAAEDDQTPVILTTGACTPLAIASLKSNSASFRMALSLSQSARLQHLTRRHTTHHRSTCAPTIPDPPLATQYPPPLDSTLAANAELWDTLWTMPEAKFH